MRNNLYGIKSIPEPTYENEVVGLILIREWSLFNSWLFRHIVVVSSANRGQ